jgi:PAS domain S-box-containing protein
MRARLVGKRGTTSVAATPFRAGNRMMLLVRASALQVNGGSVEGTQALSGFVEHMPDGVVVTDSGGRILLANRAFLMLTQMGDESVAKGQSLGQWLGGDQGPLTSILAHARRHGMAPPERADVVSVRGDRHTVLVSAVLLPEGDQECIGFTITLAPEGEAAAGPEASLAVALEHLTAQLGLASLPGLMEAAERAAERHFIATALSRAGGDHDYAAALLQVDVATLERRMQQLGLSGSEGSTGPPPRLN